MATQHPFLTTTKFIVVCFKFKVFFLAKAVNINKDESPPPPPPPKIHKKNSTLGGEKPMNFSKMLNMQ